MSCYDPSTSILAGMDEATLRAHLAQLQAAYMALVSGRRETSVSLAQNGNARTVSYTQTNIADLMAAIRQVQAQLGIVPTPRRAIGAKF